MKNGDRKNIWQKYKVTGLIVTALVLGACGQQNASPENVQSLGIPIDGQESIEASAVDSALSQPVYIGSWKVTDYGYPSTPCGLSQLEVDALIGSELIYAPEGFTCNGSVVESEGFSYEFAFYDSLTEYEQRYNVSVSGWFAEGDTGMVKCGYAAIDEGMFGDSFVFIEEQPDKMLIHYYGVVFLAVREQTSADGGRES